MVKENVFSEMSPQDRILLLSKARATRVARVAGWRKLDLRQSFLDEAFMRECAKHAGIKLPISVEPATRARLLQICRRAGILQDEILLLTGCSVENFIAKNEKWPLWALLCSIAEMSCVHHGFLIDVPRETTNPDAYLER